MISLKEVQALLLDFDGTLVDSIPVLKNVYLKFLSAIGKEGSDEEFEALNGPNIRQIMVYLKETYAIEDSLDAMEASFHEIFTNIYTKQVDFFPGVHEFLLWAKGKGLKLVIVTSAHPELVKMMLDVKGVRGLFDAVISSKDLANGKPHPEVYENALKTISIEPRHAIAFEDSEKGIAAACGAGITTFAFGTGSYPPGIESFQDWAQVLKSFENADA